MDSSAQAPSFSHKHNHARCIADAIEAAERCCSANGTRFTSLRRRVLELIWQSHQPITAYALIKLLRKEKENTEPPTVYRALEFLQQNNLAHRIESLNAFVGCDHPDKEHRSQFMICTDCQCAVELAGNNRIEKAISNEAEKLGFAISSTTVEINGVCPSCSVKTRRTGK